MIEHLGIEAQVPPDDDADIRDECACAGREATIGFETIGGIVGWPLCPSMRESCPNCASTNLVIAVDRRQQRNYFCRDCTMCWHPEFGRLRRVDPEVCPGCGLATTACFERFESPAALAV